MLEGETHERTRVNPTLIPDFQRIVTEEPVGRIGWEDMELNGFLQREVGSQGYVKLAYLPCHVCQAIEAKSLGRETNWLFIGFEPYPPPFLQRRKRMKLIKASNMYLVVG